MLLSASQASLTLGVSTCTLRRWHNNGKIAAVRSPGGVRLYDVDSVIRRAISPPPVATVSSRLPNRPEPKSYVYARVSSAKQKADLERQQQLLLAKYPQYELISDIGSGINFKRPGLRTLLERSRQGLVKEVKLFNRSFLFFLSYLLRYLDCTYPKGPSLSLRVRPPHLYLPA
jgi:putative resolvase